MKIDNDTLLILGAGYLLLTRDASNLLRSLLGRLSAVVPTSFKGLELPSDPNVSLDPTVGTSAFYDRVFGGGYTPTGEDLFSTQVFTEPTTVTTGMGWSGATETVTDPTWGDVYWWGGP